jgi:hypothetical protein
MAGLFVNIKISSIFERRVGKWSRENKDEF